MGDEGQAAGTGGGRQRQCIELLERDPEEPGHRVGHLGGVERADEGEESPGGVGEPGYRPRGIGAWSVCDRARHAARPEAEAEVTRTQAEAQGTGHIVAGTRPHDRLGAGPFAGNRVGAEHRREHGIPVHPVVDQRQQVGPVATLGRGPVPGARGVPPVRGHLTGEAEGEPVVGEEHGGHAPERLGLAALQPPELGDGEAGQGDAPTRLGPCTTAPGERSQELPGVGCRLGVVPQLGGPHDVTPSVEDDGTMLLRGDGDGRRLDIVGTGHGPGHGEGFLPGLGVLFAAGRSSRGMWCPPRADERAGVSVPHLHLARRRRGVDTDDQGH